jgi:hypothetical protein
MSISMNLESYQRKDYQDHTIENAIMTGAYADTFKDTQDIIKCYGLYATVITAALTMTISIWCNTGHKY